MMRVVVFGCTVLFALSSAAFGGDYLLRLETVGYVAQPIDDRVPTEAPLRSMELLVRPGQRFYARTTMGEHSVMARGQLNAVGANEQFSVQLEFRQERDTGINVQVAPGQRARTLDKQAHSTHWTGRIGERRRVGEMIVTTDDQRGRKETRSSLFLTLTKYEPRAEE